MNYIESDSFNNSYSKGVLFVNLNFPLHYTENELSIEKLSSKELGAFFHEYIHYYQNIATTFGLLEGGIILQRMSYTLQEATTTPNNIISIPYQLKKNPNKKNEEILKKYIGDNITDEDYRVLIDKQSIIYTEVDDSILISFTDEVSKKKMTRKVGTLDLKEGMAAKCQSIIDSSNQQSDIPYNILWILCEKFFKNITTKMFICICYSSLFYKNPIVAFIQMCQYYNSNPMNVKSIFEQEKKIFSSCFLKKQKVYVEYIKNTLSCNIPYIEQTINNMSDFPLVNLIEDGLNSDKIKKFLQQYGVPLIRSFNKDHFEWHFPSLKNKNTAQDLVSLKGRFILYDYITGNSSTCQFLAECDKQQDSCYENKLWKTNTDCVFKTIWNDLKFKNIKISEK